MKTDIELNEYDERVVVTTLDSGTVIRELEQRARAPKDIQRDAILAQLEAIDAATDKPRTRREVQIGRAATLTWLAEQDAAAEALRAELAAIR